MLANWYVATNGSDTTGLGTLAQPFGTIQRGMNSAVAGDTVYVRGGIYREQLYVNAGHTGVLDNGVPKYVTIAAYNDEVPDIRGSAAVTGWTVHSGNVWKKTGWSQNSQQVFDDGVPLQQIGMTGYQYSTSQYVPTGSGLADMQPGRFFYDKTATTLYVQLTDNSDPNLSLMEASRSTNYGRTFMAEASREYMRLQGLTFRHSNTSGTAEQGAMVNLGSNSIAEDCIFRDSDFTGLSLGWRTTNVKVINSQFFGNGALGLAGSESQNFHISGSTFTNNNYRRFSTQWHAGGMKLVPRSYGIIEGNEVAFNRGSGIWFDHCDDGGASIIRGNYIHDNSPNEAGIFFEASSNALIYNNVLVNNTRRGIYISGSTDAKVFNNTIVAQKGLSAIEVLPRSGVNSTYTLVHNNTISGGTSTNDLYMSPGTGNASDYNNIHRAGTPSLRLNYYGSSYTSLINWRNATGFDMNSINVDPGFAGGTGSDYRLGFGSALINAATSLAEVATDYLSVARPSGAVYDIGAFEYSFSSVTGRHLFYNRSYFDANNAAATVQDDLAIAPDKQALFAGQTATFANYSSYSRGINGLMVDIAGLPAGTLTPSDFSFRFGNESVTPNPSTWAVAPDPSSITVRPGEGVGGADRVTLIWDDNAIQKTWLQVTVRSTANTGLQQPDVFYLGNAVGESGNATTHARVDSSDEIGARLNPRTPSNRATLSDRFDYNRDSLVNSSDQIVARLNATTPSTMLKLIQVPLEMNVTGSTVQQLQPVRPTRPLPSASMSSLLFRPTSVLRSQQRSLLS